MSRIYIYKMTTDDGGAPCVRDDLLTLAICKPAIRSVAKRGDLILAFAGNELYRDNCLIYAARVTDNLDGREYFSESRYRTRPDCICSWDGCRFEGKADARFHPSPANLLHDLGEPPEYGRAHVVLSDGAESFRYFGDKCPVGYKDEFPNLAALIQNLGQGHRVNFGPSLLAELRRFIARLWDVPSAYRETPVPESVCEHNCGASNDEGVLKIEC
jgi:hypothetical protein